MAEVRPLNIPVILGTTRKGRMSAHAARFLTNEIGKRDGVVTELIDIGQLSLPVDDAGEGVQDTAFSAKVNRADALVIVAPEYNHSFPGLAEACAGQLPQGIHPQGRRHRRCSGGSVRRNAGHREPSAGASRAGSGGHLLGCQLWEV